MQNPSDVPAAVRLAAIQLLRNNLGDAGDVRLAREVEAHAHAVSYDPMHYNDVVLRCARNCHHNPSNACATMASHSNVDLLRGTRLEETRRCEEERRLQFDQMLRQKMETLVETGGDYKSSLRCRRCKSSEVSWELKQTRSADEACTAFCVCASCGNRWTMN